jgi:hypothetical protein
MHLEGISAKWILAQEIDSVSLPAAIIAALRSARTILASKSLSQAFLAKSSLCRNLGAAAEVIGAGF